MVGIIHPLEQWNENAGRTFFVVVVYFRTVTLNYKMLTNATKKLRKFWMAVCNQNFLFSVVQSISLSVSSTLTFCVRSYLFFLFLSLTYFLSFIHSFRKTCSSILTLLRSFTNCFYFCVPCVYLFEQRTWDHSVWMGTCYFVTIISPEEYTPKLKITVFLYRSCSMPGLFHRGKICSGDGVDWKRCQ